MQKYILPLFIAVLGLTATGLGYLIFQQSSPQAPPQETPQEESSPSSEEEQVLQTPGPDATEEERRAHFELARRLATESDVLDISACEKADPVILKLTEGQTFTVRNNDDTEHAMVLNEDTAYRIPAGGSIELVADFGRGPGLYGYGCDNVPQAVGMLLVEPKE